MAAATSKPAMGRRSGKGIRGRVPVKRSINLVLVNENKIALKKAVPSVLAIIVLAALFGKYLVADRLVAMSRATNRVTQLQRDLDNALSQINEIGDVEDSYAHYTYDGMTQAELGLVDRTKVVELVKSILPTGNTEKSWSVSENILTVELTGKTLDELNEIARKIEEDPIVDSCTITTANKNDRNNKTQKNSIRSSKTKTSSVTEKTVRGRFIVYLRQPEEEVAP